MKPRWRTVSWLHKPAIALALTMLPASIQAARAQDYPSRPITIIVPLVAGGSVDVVARILADRMKTTLGQPIVVENIPTAAGTVGVGRLAQATPDGYTIGMGDQTTHMVSSLVNSVRYDVLNDLEPISLLSTSSVALVARKTMPAADVKQLIVWLREQPEGATAGSFGQGSGPHVISTAFQNLTGTKLRLVTYRGTPLALQDVVGGQIDLLFLEQSNMISQLREGTIKAYAVLSKNRSAALPERSDHRGSGRSAAACHDLARDVGAERNAGRRAQQTPRCRRRSPRRSGRAKANCRDQSGNRAARAADA